MAQGPLLEELNERSREVFRRLVEAYLETGEPVGSRTLTRSLTEKVSAATIRREAMASRALPITRSPGTTATSLP